MLATGRAQRSAPKAWRRDSSPVEAQATDVPPLVLSGDDVASQMRKLRFPLARPGHDATVKLLFLA